MASFFRAAASFVGYSGPQHEESPEFLRKLDGFRSHVSEVQKVRDAMQLYSDAAEAMLAAQVVLGEALDSYYQTAAEASAAASSSSGLPAPAAPACHSIAQAYKVSAVEMYAHVRPALHEVFVARCVRPATFVLAGVPAVHEQLAERKKLIAAFDEVRTAIESQKAYDKQALKSPALARHEARLGEVATQLSTLDGALSCTLDEFAEARPRMLAQELAAAVACSYYQAQQLGEQLSPLLSRLPQAASSLCLLQAASASRERRRGAAAQVQVQHSGSSSSRAQAEIEEFVLERSRVAGGRSGGYGLQSSASDGRRRSLRRVPGSVPEVELQSDDLLGIQEQGAAGTGTGTGDSSAPPPPKPPRPVV